MEVEVEGKIALLGMEISKKDYRLETKVYVRPTNTGLSLHYYSHVYKLIQAGLINPRLKLCCSKQGQRCD